MVEYLDLGGTIRARPPEETLALVRPLLSSFGITRVARITGLDHIGIPVSLAIRPDGKLLSNAQGKGITPELADLSAIMESIESWHAENLLPPTRIASCRDVSRDGPVVSPDVLPRPPCLRRAIDPAIGFDRELAWTEVREVLSDREYWFPWAFFDLDTSSRLKEAAGIQFHTTTNGLASGNTRTEALLHGLYEVIERDARYHLDRLPAQQLLARRIDLSTLRSPHLLDLLERLRRADMYLEVLDMTADVPLPAFHASIAQLHHPTRSFADEGMGAHLVPEVALSRAITEAAQSRLSYIAGSRDDVYPSSYRGLALPAPRDLRAAPGGKDLAACVRPVVEPSLEQNLRLVLDLLRGRGVTQVFVHEHTRAAWGIPVVHVFIPALHNGIA